MTSDRKNVLVLAVCQALLVTGNVILVALDGLAGRALAAEDALATLPITAFVLGGAFATMPASLLMHRVGRARGFAVGASFGVAGGVACAAAVHAGSFWLLCVGNLLWGVGNACASYYRFAAADAAGSLGKERAISLVLAGGLVGGVLGPESSKLTKDLFAVPFLGSYLSLVALAGLALALVSRLEIPPLTQEERMGASRPLAQIARQPVFAVAVLSGAVAYAVMNLLMTATPLAMQSCHHPYAAAAFVIEWHVIGMYAPSFVTGALVRRFGLLEIMLAGVALMLGCVAIALSGEDVARFWTALFLLGVGWNFLYVGATTLLTEAYVPAERAKTQGANDFVVFASMTISSLGSGALVTSAGWRTVNLAALPLLALVAVAVVALRMGRGAPEAGAGGG